MTQKADGELLSFPPCLTKLGWRMLLDQLTDKLFLLDCVRKTIAAREGTLLQFQRWGQILLKSIRILKSSLIRILNPSEKMHLE